MSIYDELRIVSHTLVLFVSLLLLACRYGKTC